MPLLIDPPYAPVRRLPDLFSVRPGHLLGMVCDSAYRCLDSAEQALRRGDSRDANRDLRRTRRILLELMGALDRSVSPDLTETLSTFYQGLFDRVSEALLSGDPDAVADTAQEWRCWQEAWSQAARGCG